MLAAAVLATLTLTGCAQTATTESNAAAEDSAAVTESVTDAVSDSVTAEGVLLAAVLLSTADIEAAVAEGLVTPGEVDEAQRAIDAGTLDEWRELAETAEQD
ncbi:hypothetical protein [Salinibacterium sp. ZJ454]|uniref:hypothetical protein n=1 Tax=Salinibacterium sp. ZJ454 TaxID=2708339 RepID=UPI001AB060FD|nr:hypothetical protein [Salinibacterium sp. ZJ454]